jgi:serine/threonine protein kinase
MDQSPSFDPADLAAEFEESFQDLSVDPEQSIRQFLADKGLSDEQRVVALLCIVKGDLARRAKSRFAFGPGDYLRFFPELLTDQCVRELVVIQRDAVQEAETPSSKDFGKYRIVGELGSGGAAIVHRAVRLDDGEQVALKILRDSGKIGEALRRRFLEEGDRLKKVEHENVVKVFESGIVDGRPYIAMELCQKSLDSLLKESVGHVLTPSDAVKYVLQAAKGIQALHSAGVVHRDITPKNLLLGRDGLLKVTDLGVSKDLQQHGQTMSVEQLGTLFYMSPEQARNAATVGLSADIYSLGAVLYRCLVGHPPFTERESSANAQPALLRLMSWEDPVPVRKFIVDPENWTTR